MDMATFHIHKWTDWLTGARVGVWEMTGQSPTWTLGWASGSAVSPLPGIPGYHLPPALFGCQQSLPWGLGVRSLLNFTSRLKSFPDLSVPPIPLPLALLFAQPKVPTYPPAE